YSNILPHLPWRNRHCLLESQHRLLQLSGTEQYCCPVIEKQRLSSCCYLSFIHHLERFIPLLRLEAAADQCLPSRNVSRTKPHHVKEILERIFVSANSHLALSHQQAVFGVLPVEAHCHFKLAHALLPLLFVEVSASNLIMQLAFLLVKMRSFAII